MATPEVERKQRLQDNNEVPAMEDKISVEHDQPCTDHPEERALDLVFAGKSLFVKGLAGSGNT